MWGLYAAQNDGPNMVSFALARRANGDNERDERYTTDLSFLDEEHSDYDEADNFNFC